MDVILEPKGFDEEVAERLDEVAGTKRFEEVLEAKWLEEVLVKNSESLLSPSLLPSPDSESVAMAGGY